MKKVSIIVPVYNVEKYLEKCLKSLINQTLKDIEIIIINDGSTDSSKKIIDDFKSKYPDMIKAFHLENQGAARARNYALNFASGEYIGFVDSDDYISEEMYEKLYNKAKEEKAEIICCNYYRVINNKRMVKIQFGNKKINKDELFNKNVYQANLLFEEFPYVWNKIFKTELIKEHKIDFCPDLRIYEDLLFTYKAFSKVNKISRVDDFLYFYTVSNKKSLTHEFTEKRFDIFKVSERLVNYYKEINRYEEVKEAILYVILKHLYIVLMYVFKNDFTNKKLKLKYINNSFKLLNKEFPNWKDNMYFELQDKNKKIYKSKNYWKFKVVLGNKIDAKIKKTKQKIKDKLSFCKKIINKLKNIVRR